jgi:hypothetical protein
VILSLVLSLVSVYVVAGGVEGCFSLRDEKSLKNIFKLGSKLPSAGEMAERSKAPA